MSLNPTSPWLGATLTITTPSTLVPPTSPSSSRSPTSSLLADRALARTYGGGGIPTYWIVNPIDRQLEVYANPTGGGYPDPTMLAESAAVELIVAGEVVAQIPVVDLLPRKPKKAL